MRSERNNFTRFYGTVEAAVLSGNYARAKPPRRRPLQSIQTLQKWRQTVSGRRHFPPLSPLKLFGHRTVQLLHGIAHVLPRFLQVVEFLLLIRRQDWTDLRHRFVYDRMGFIHRVFVNGDDLRPGLVDQRLDLRLLLSCQIQSLGQMSHRKSLTVPATVASAKPTLGLGQSVAGDRDRADWSECK